MDWAGTAGLQWLAATSASGAWGIGRLKQWLAAARDDESLAALRRAIELGVNLIDTALAYGDGHSERLVGHAEVARRRAARSTWPPRSRPGTACGPPPRRLKPYTLTITSWNRPKRACATWGWTPSTCCNCTFGTAPGPGGRNGGGRSKTSNAPARSAPPAYRSSEHDPDSGLGAVRTGLIDAVQVIYNIFDQAPERSLFPLCQAENVGVLARVPLDEGGLTGRVGREHRLPPGRFPRVVLPRRPQARGGRTRGRPAERPGRRRQPAGHRAALLPLAPGRFFGNPGDAHPPARGGQRRHFGCRAAALGHFGRAAPARLGPQLLPVAHGRAPVSGRARREPARPPPNRGIRPPVGGLHGRSRAIAAPSCPDRPRGAGPRGSGFRSCGRSTSRCLVRPARFRRASRICRMSRSSGMVSINCMAVS